MKDLVRKALDGTAGAQSPPRIVANPSAAIVFERYHLLPKLFAFNLEKLDINLLIYPATGRMADRDAALLLVYGYEEILDVDEVNEAYLCRKLGETRDRLHNARPESFDAALSDAAAFKAHEITDHCVASGFLERLSVVAGGSLRLAPYARQHVEGMALDLDRSAH